MTFACNLNWLNSILNQIESKFLNWIKIHWIKFKLNRIELKWNEMQIDMENINWKYARHFTHPWLWYWKKKKTQFQRDRFEIIHNKIWIEIYFGRNILLVNPKLIYPILALILQLSQKLSPPFWFMVQMDFTFPLESL